MNYNDYSDDELALTLSDLTNALGQLENTDADTEREARIFEMHRVEKREQLADAKAEAKGRGLF